MMMSRLVSANLWYTLICIFWWNTKFNKCNILSTYLRMWNRLQNMIVQYQSVPKGEIQKCFDQWKTLWKSVVNTKGTVLNKINVSVIVYFFFGKYSFSIDTYWTCIVFTVQAETFVFLFHLIISSKAPFSIATTTRCRKGCYSIPRIAPL